VRTTATIVRLLEPLKASIHSARLGCICRVVLAALFVSRLSLSDLGRSLARFGTAKTKHAIKSVDRLLGNLGQEDVDEVQRHFASFLAGKGRRPVFLIDWTDIGSHWTALVVTYVSAGRGVVLCWDVRPIGRKNSPRVEATMISRLAKLLAQYEVSPIIISDAGFRCPWLTKLKLRNWDFVSRVRGRVKVRASNQNKWDSVKMLWPLAKKTPRDLGTHSLAQYRPIDVRLVALRPKGKKWRSTEPLPAVKRRTKRNIKAAREPLILATSLPTTTSAKAVAEMYALRWQIELTFRDQKSGRFGLALDEVRTKQLKRINAYLTLAALAHYVAFVTGAEAEKAGVAPDYQANTERKRRVLSLPRLGAEILRRAAMGFLEDLRGLVTHATPLAPPLLA
jgi:hypothetical protein